MDNYRVIVHESVCTLISDKCGSDVLAEVVENQSTVLGQFANFVTKAKATIDNDLVSQLIGHAIRGFSETLNSSGSNNVEEFESYIGRRIVFDFYMANSTCCLTLSLLDEENLDKIRTSLYREYNFLFSPHKLH